MLPAPTAAEPAATAATALTCVSVPGWTEQEAAAPVVARLKELLARQPPAGTNMVSSSLARPMHHLDDLQVCLS